VKSAFDSLPKELIEAPNLNTLEEKIFKNIWESPVQSKVIVFSWQLLHNSVPTKDNLLSRGILNGDVNGTCVWCGDVRESAIHLFMHCKVAMEVWYAIFKWLGVVIVMPSNLFLLFDCCWEAAKTKKDRKGILLIWHTVLWSIWAARNNHIFNNVISESSEIVDNIKLLSWRWSGDRLKIPPCLFYEWLWDPGDCFKR
jgi:hypothetical protein